jgi:uncharacterized protein (TIGR03084 family)
MSEEAAFSELLQDLQDEQRDLDVALDSVGDEEWQRATRAERWEVRDQVFHLARFDELGALSITDTAEFRSRRDAWQSDVAAHRDQELSRARDASRAETVAWWQSSRLALLDALKTCTPRQRLEWWGPSMSARSFATARLMETWAHGWDVMEAIDHPADPTDRLKHVVQLGFITRRWSYVNQGREVPDTPVRLELSAPSGAEWAWGPADAPETITGSALDFALVVAQRRHVDETGLRAAGDSAREWLLIAQCFAGPPTTTQKGR